jgi:hypothetical protein
LKMKNFNNRRFFMNPFFSRLNAMHFMLAILAFLFLITCSSEETPGEVPPLSSPSNGEAQQNWCVYTNLKQCFQGSFSECPGGGIVTFACPYSSSSNSNGNSDNNGDLPQNWCIYIDAQMCFQGSFAECPGGGIVASACPYSSASSTTSSPSTVNSSPSAGNSSPSTGTSSPSAGNSSPSAGNSSSATGSGVASSSSVNSGAIPTPGTAGPVACYGKLKASGNKLVGSKVGSNAVQVRGVSLGWSNTGWESARFFDAATVNAMVDSWKAEIIRAPMGYSENGGYQSQPTQNKTRIETVVNAAIAKGVYVIIDWHSHNAHSETAAAKTFFTEMAQKYGSYDNVIFEVYNEPISAPWTTIKTYATDIISAIRTYSDNLVLVGTPSWDQELGVVTSSTKINDANVAYVLHFYAAEHSLNFLQTGADAVLNANLPIFVSEYGTVMADGDGMHSAANTNAWMTYLDNKKISSCAWNVNDKPESSAFFGTGAAFDKTSWTNTSKMTESGQYVYSKLTSYYANAPWRTCSFSNTPGSSSSGSGGGTKQYCDYGIIDSYGGGCYVIYSASECDTQYGTIRSSCSRKQYCDYGPEDEWGGGCFELDDANECDLEWGVLANSCS